VSQAEQRQQQLRLASGLELLLAKHNGNSYSSCVIESWLLYCGEDADPSWVYHHQCNAALVRAK